MFRDMRRAKQALDTTTCQRILSEAKRGVLSVLGDDGYPYGVPINFVFDPTQGRHGALYFHSATTGHKLDAIRTCDKASFTTRNEGTRNEGEWWYYVDSVICFGRARLVEDPQLKHDALFRLASKYFPADYDIEADIAKNLGRVQVIELRIEHMSGKHVQEK